MRSGYCFSVWGGAQLVFSKFLSIRVVLSAASHLEILLCFHLDIASILPLSCRFPPSFFRPLLAVDCFVNILEVLRFRAARTKLVYASSSSVYGVDATIPFTEKECSDRPASIYGASKRMNEMQAHAYHHLYNVSATGLRFFTVYGPWGRPDMAPYIFTERIAKGMPIDVFHTPTGADMKRDFTYVGDIVDGIMRAMRLGAGYEVFNLGRGRPSQSRGGRGQGLEGLVWLFHPLFFPNMRCRSSCFPSLLLFSCSPFRMIASAFPLPTASVPEFVGYIEEYTEKKAVQREAKAHDAELPVTFADTTHAEDKLNYRPQMNTKHGVELFVKWYVWYQEIGARGDFPSKDFYLPSNSV